MAHTALRRVEQVARHWAQGGCPVVIHVDGTVPDPRYAALRRRLEGQPLIGFAPRHRCEWGGWGIVAASRDAAQMVLDGFEDVTHVYLTSGACLPLRPVGELRAFLARHPETDFIESARPSDVPWTVGGFEQDRFDLYFPFSWQRQRWLFDKAVTLQRRLGINRARPVGLHPHMGSQWWCLTRVTLRRILTDPKRPAHDRYFKRVWIPDESYFQTLARRHARRIESRSLTLSRFDSQGKPHVFHDDHLELLQESGSFVARKIWPHADRLYDTFLSPARRPARVASDPARIDRLFEKAGRRRTRGRPGLYMQSRYPHDGWENGATAGPYSVFHGFTDLFDGFEAWLAKTTGTRVHGHLFAPDRAQFSNGQRFVSGALSDHAGLRDANPKAFLTSLIWNTRGERQCFQHGPRDTPGVMTFMAPDPNAQISVITGAWAVSLCRSGISVEACVAKARRLQAREHKAVAHLRARTARAQIRIWSLADFMRNPVPNLLAVTREIATAPQQHLNEAPVLQDLEGLAAFLQALRNHGLHLPSVGPFPQDGGEASEDIHARAVGGQGA
nr:beta-1,6-N-acetylglucosaminyltransferase [Cognatishimia sp. F0-27]